MNETASDNDNISMTRYGATSGGGAPNGGASCVTFAGLKDETSLGGDSAASSAVAAAKPATPTDPLLLNTKSHHHPRRDTHHQPQGSDSATGEDTSTLGSAGERLFTLFGAAAGGSDDTSSAGGADKEKNRARIRRLAIDLSLYINLLILLTKLIAYAQTLSLSVLAALTDSVLDVVSQMVLNYTERHSSLSRSSALYPAGAARLEPLGVLTCAALMGMASFEIIKESAESLLIDRDSIASDDDEGMASFWSMLAIVLVKLGLWVLCLRSAKTRTIGASSSFGAEASDAEEGGGEGGGADRPAPRRVISDPTIEALAQDHWNDALSNAVAAAALLFALSSPALWFLDPMGAILISVYIIYSWYETGKEQIEQLTGKCAPADFIGGIRDLAANFDNRMEVDVVRAYHFGPKFLVEIEVVLPRDTLLFESHDLGMELQYEIEAMEDVERCFVHIDYETRPYDEHVVSKLPELREKIRTQMSGSSLGCHSV